MRYNTSVPKRTLLIVAGIASSVSSYFGAFMGSHAVAGANHSVLFAISWIFPVLSLAGFLAYLVSPIPGLICSWLLLAGAFIGFFLMYRHFCLQSTATTIGIVACVRCTLLLAWHLRIMFASALCLQLAGVRKKGHGLIARFG